MGQAAPTLCRPACNQQTHIVRADDTDSCSHPITRLDDLLTDAWIPGLSCSSVCVSARVSATAADSECEHIPVVAQECCIESNATEAIKTLFVDLPRNSRAKLLQPHLHHRFADHYEIFDKLGEGSFGDVFEARHNSVDDNEKGLFSAFAPKVNNAADRCVAVKIFSVGGSGRDLSLKVGSEIAKRRRSFETERTILASLEHPHIVRMHECFREQDSLFIVMELCRGGELYSRLVDRPRQVGNGGFNEELSKLLFRQMLQAVAYMHSMNIVHRDIKTENFLLLGEEGTPEGDVLKLCDFGTSARLTPQRPRCMDNIGTLSYTAPEVYAHKGAACAADNWSLGVVLYVVLTAMNPFRHPGKSKREDTVRRICAGRYEQNRSSWKSVSSRAKDLVRRLIVIEEGARWTSFMALKHEWVLDGTRSIFDVEILPGLELHVPRLITLLTKMPHLSKDHRLALAACAMATAENDIQTVGMPWRELFLDLDQDNDGRLSYAEMLTGLKWLLREAADQLSESQLLECTLSLDLDESGYIEWVEFMVVGILCLTPLPGASETWDTAMRLLETLSGTAKSALEAPKSPTDAQWAATDDDHCTQQQSYADNADFEAGHCAQRVFAGLFAEVRSMLEGSEVHKLL